MTEEGFARNGLFILWCYLSKRILWLIDDIIHIYLMMSDKFEDTYGVIRDRQSMKDIQYNDALYVFSFMTLSILVTQVVIIFVLKEY